MVFSQLKSLIKKHRQSVWKLGILENGYTDLINKNIHWISNGKYKNKWFADPFILKNTPTEILLLVEEFDYKVNRGRIAQITISKKEWTIIKCKILLDLPTHLSFPAIYKVNNKIFVHPENNESGESIIYQYNEIQQELIPFKKISDIRLTDAIIINIQGEFFMLSTNEPTPNGKTLAIYKSNNFLGEYTFYENIIFKDNCARNAGLPFYNSKQELIRPAQECNVSYGHGIVFQEIIFKDRHFYFKEKNRITSPHSKFNLGIHTYNTLNELAVIDVKGYRTPIIGKLCDFIHIILVKINLRPQYIIK